jgi:hypothetical protein
MMLMSVALDILTESTSLPRTSAICLCLGMQYARRSPPEPGRGALTTSAANVLACFPETSDSTKDPQEAARIGRCPRTMP